MPISSQIQYADINDLRLDPRNPRLGREHARPDTSQEEIMELMREWTLEELAESFLESGFWPQEALLVVREPLYGEPQLVVVEGNRRLAALKYLRQALDGRPANRKWAQMVQEKQPPPHLFQQISYLLADTREEVAAFIGFRHVTGIKEWHPAEKAEYIAKLIEERGLSYDEVRRRIGSKTPTVRQNYIAYRLLLQMEQQEDVSIEQVESKFSLLFLSLRARGVQEYLHIDTQAEPDHARIPVPADRREQLRNFALWMFGDDTHDPLLPESRDVDDFGQILQSAEAVAYLERTDRPMFDVAYKFAGGDLPEVIRLVAQAADNIELALGTVHRHAESIDLRSAVQRCWSDAEELVRHFPGIDGASRQEG